MKTSYKFQSLPSLFTAALVAAAGVILPVQVPAQAQPTAVSQRQFASPDEAVKALREAAEAGDKDAVHAIFGTDNHDLLTGDEVQDKANFQGFSRALAASCVQVPEGGDIVTLTIGTNNWPFPIPLLKTNGQWVFDTAAGREEIINRHIGRGELNAIGVCRAFVVAQREYYSKDHDGSGVPKYALKFKSTPGKEDGLYWKSTGEPSPFALLEAEAHAEGYHHPQSGASRPFHGYLFRVLTRQGRAAPGGRTDYLVNGNLTGGFALIAYPVEWGKSGIMTFIVSQDGKVYQENLGERTASLAGKITRYNPDGNWTLVSDEGVCELPESH